MKCYIVFLVAIIIKIYTCTPTGLFYILSDNSTNDSCPSQPCTQLKLLNQHLNISGTSISNVNLLFLSGKHSLTSNIIMQHVYNVTMVGVNSGNIPPAVLSCHFTKTSIGFVNSSNITIANLVFENCGPKVYVGLFSIPVMAAAYFSTCYSCNITNVTFIGYGLAIRNLLGESYLDSITVHLHAPVHNLLHWYNQGIGLINTGNSPYCVTSHNLIHMRKITIIGHNNTQASFEYTVVGIYIAIF